jgi:Fe-S cluster assembly iron-binding protein IscA
MALDESSDAQKDLTRELGGLTFVIEQSDANAAGPLTVDYLQNETGEGFVIRPDQAGESSCSSCSGSCGG